MVYPSKQLPKEKNPLADVQGKLDAQVGALFFGDPDGEDIQIDEEKAIENLYQTLEAANSMKEAPAPPELKISLLPHQAQGLYWLSCQEQGPHRGGILADEVLFIYFLFIFSDHFSYILKFRWDWGKLFKFSLLF